MLRAHGGPTRGSSSHADKRPDGRLCWLRWGLVAVAALLVVRLFDLQIFRGDLYTALAAGQHELYEKLFPVRGSIYVKEKRNGKEELFPLVTNRELNLLYAVPTAITDASSTADKLLAVFTPSVTLSADDEASIREGLDETLDPALADEIITTRRTQLIEARQQQARQLLVTKLSKPDDPYEALERRLTDEQVEQIKALKIEGLGFQPEIWRYYPEKGLGGQLFGFWGYDDTRTDGLNRAGKYGLEGYFDDELSGALGEIHSERDAWGNLIAVGTKSFTEKIDGSDLVLTIDRAIQYQACKSIAEAVDHWQARSGSVIVLEPRTGAVLAMCSAPDYDPSEYNKVSSVSLYRNPAVNAAYEPGSIFKPLTMAGALDTGVVSANTTFTDTGSEKIGPFTIKNFNDKVYGLQTMTQVLENSVNTGVIYAMRQMTPKVFSRYVKDFGFGEPTKIELAGEAKGDISNLLTNKEIYAATASFGQGVTVTPLQIVTAIAAIANGGKLMQPHVVSEIRHPDGQVETTSPTMVRQVVSSKSAAILSGMMVSVVENGHGKLAGVPGYRVAGKTGTAQVAKTQGSGYEEGQVAVSFVGFAPFQNPRFVMLVTLDRPQRGKEAASTVTITFKEIANFILNYYNVPHDR